eukprot:2563889-Pyramimonas_sp.AAC.1
MQTPAALRLLAVGLRLLLLHQLALPLASLAPLLQVLALLPRPAQSPQYGHSTGWSDVKGNSPKTPYRPREAGPPSCPVARASCPVDHPDPGGPLLTQHRRSTVAALSQHSHNTVTVPSQYSHLKASPPTPPPPSRTPPIGTQSQYSHTTVT